MFLQFYFLQLFEKQIKVAWKYLEKCDISYVVGSRLDRFYAFSILLMGLKRFKSCINWFTIILFV